MSRNRKQEEESRAISSCLEKMAMGELAPWKVEEELAANLGIPSPRHFRVAALCRRRYVEELAGERFEVIKVPNKSYKALFVCEKDNLEVELDIGDRVRSCSLCGGPLKPFKRYAPLVASYIGGSEDYYSYAGSVSVHGDLEKDFVNLMVYGTGLGPIGVTRGCFLIRKAGGAEVRVAGFARAVRCLGFVFASQELRRKAAEVISEILPELRKEVEKGVSARSGRFGGFELFQAETNQGFLLYADFMTEFENFRGHKDTSQAVGWIKTMIEERLMAHRIPPKLSVIAQGHDGDLKPSARNKRGRYVSACIRVPLLGFQQLFRAEPERFLSFVEVDRLGAEKLGCPFYSGMGGEIIPAVYRAVKVNPRSPLVSSFQDIEAGVENGDLLYRVKLPNLEAGVVSSDEGLIPPTGREALRVMGIQTASDFAASVAVQVLAGEFNLALEITRGKLYR